MSDMPMADFLRARIHERLDLVEHVIDGLVRLPHKPGSIGFEGQTIYDPRSELVECDAKARIVQAYEVADPYDPDDGFRGLQHSVRCLALPYADHPDYRQEWKP